MDDQNQQILDILAKYEAGTITEDELQQLEDWYASFEANPDLIESLSPEERLVRKKNNCRKRSSISLGPRHPQQ
ncbi:hypothetical protein KUH03_01230 [Sphingobacterium sp. E70]|uniref:hypothetical protein n=1 Tax=Sphingobacterium sp. E70 TaxID=2853439 RepID=UPI00211C03E2|nr:hypothetical protein [Sphingobacterium sp. E70]ULT25662.1 hypothetical protein KUH03_01230 [Sphingobacterium sp. E70]